MAASNPLRSLLQGDQLTPSDATLAALAKGIGHAFTRPELAGEALTHRSALDRQPALKAALPHGNERLEFLGDRVLSLAMADLLLKRFPQEREGELARRHASLVQAETLVDIAEEIGLGAYLVLGASEQRARVRPAILADGFEALLGAIFLDAGFDAASAVVERLFKDRLARQRTAPRDPKTELQEWAQAHGLPLPKYREVGREGAAHTPMFVVDVVVKGQEPSQARGGSKREAERLAAAALLERLLRA